MRKNYSKFGISFFVLACIVFTLSKINDENNIDLLELRESHKKHLKNSPFKETLKLSKAERKAKGLPPNKYYEREWELTMNPTTGKPEPLKVLQLQKELSENGISQRTPGDAIDNLWVERGPNNVGGRTRVVFYDPTDSSNSRVFAGGVSGGLWVTDDISTNGGWTLVSGLPTNLSITCYAIDPNDNNTWYLGSGEQSTYGNAVGRGVYKTTDAGATWTQVLNVYDFDTDASTTYEFIGGLHFINDIVAWNNNGSTEIYVGVSSHLYGDSNDPLNILGYYDRGLYHSIDGGANWTKDISNISVNDFEIDANGDLWFATTSPSPFSGTGGEIYKRLQGPATTFTVITTIPNAYRTEIEASVTNANKFYVLAQTSTNPVIYSTTDAFASTLTSITPPNDPDSSVSSTDFTRGQSFYDLVIEVDPTDDNIIYVGGINLHRSTDGGANWNTISHWSTFYSTAGSNVHADQHALTFNPSNPNQAVLGHDGGVSFASDLSATGNNLTVIYDVDDTYNVTQFYSGSIAPGDFDPGDYMVAGAQDNGTLYIQGGDPTGPDAGTRIKGGDGAYSFIDQVDTDYVLGNYIYNNSIELYDYSAGGWRTVNSDSNNDGDFINPSGLDSNLDILYTNGTSGSIYKIYRYSNLTEIPAAGTATKSTLFNGLLTNSPTAFTVSPHTTTSTLLLVGTADGKVLKLLNAEAAPLWSDISGPGFVGSVSDVEFGSSENEIFITFHNYGVTSVWYSSDAGASWSAKEGDLPDMPVKAILQNPLNTDEVIVGTELGVWATTNFTDASPTWIQTINGMSDVRVVDLDLRTSDNTVLATTHGRGMFTGQFLAGSLSRQDGLVLNSVGLAIHPTVSKGTFNLTSKTFNGKLSIQVYDITGKQVYTNNVNMNAFQRETLNLNGKQSGLYLIKISDGSFNVTQKVIIK